MHYFWINLSTFYFSYNLSEGYLCPVWKIINRSKATWTQFLSFNAIIFSIRHRKSKGLTAFLSRFELGEYFGTGIFMKISGYYFV